MRDGSSPLTRGKHVPALADSGAGGLIPAHAGKTSPASRAWCGQGAHPRSRGENDVPPVPEVPHAGSSPLTRGKPAFCDPLAPPGGLIPAHAGKTRFGLAPWPHGRAHPRSRGENPRRPGFGLVGEGSSPLTRGKHRAGTRDWSTNGLIPAHAGKTAAFTACAVGRRAHPRSRGENSTRRWSGTTR